MRAWIALFTALAFLASASPQPAQAQQDDEEEEEEDNSLEQSTEETSEDSTESTTEESTEEPTANTSSREQDEDPDDPEDEEKDDDDFDEALTIAGLAILVIALSAAAICAARKPARAATRHDKKALAYLRENESALRTDLARGEGPTIDDLAAAYRVPPEHRDEFGAALRARRAELVELLDPASLDAMRARAFVGRVGDILRDDATLRRDWENWRLTVGLATPPSSSR